MAADDPFADIGSKASDPFGDIGAPSATKDVFKQIPAGLVAGVEAIPAFPAQAVGLVGTYLEPAIERAVGYFSPTKAAEMRAAAQERRDFGAALREKYGAPGVESYLPKPETTAGKFARTTAEFVPATVAGTRLALPRAVGVGTTAGVASEAAGQATEGTPFEPAARVVAPLVAGTAAMRQAERATARAALPSIAELDARGAAGYDAWRASGMSLTPQASPTYAFITRGELQQRGLTDVTADQTHRVLQRMERQPATTPQELHAAYQELGNVARNARDANERLAANMAQERLLQFMENPPAWTVAGGDPAQAVGLLREANANWAAARRAENLNRRIATSETRAGSNYSGLNLENELRRRVGVLGEETVRGGFTPDEQRAFRQFAEGSYLSNVRRYARGILGGGGGLGALAAGGAGAGIGGSLGIDPLTYAGGTLLTGLALAKLGNRASLSQARQLEDMLRARSPLAVQTAAPPPMAAAPLALLPPTGNTLATLGE